MSERPKSGRWTIEDFFGAARQGPLRFRHQESSEFAIIDRDHAVAVLTNQLRKSSPPADWKTPLAVGATIGIVLPITDWDWSGERLGLSGQTWYRIFLVAAAVSVVWFAAAAITRLVRTPLTAEQLYESLAGNAVTELGATSTEPGNHYTPPTTMPPTLTNLVMSTDARLEVGSRVGHPTHGSGTVISMTSRHGVGYVAIEFDDVSVGERELLTELSPLAVILEE